MKKLFIPAILFIVMISCSQEKQTSNPEPDIQEHEMMLIPGGEFNMGVLAGPDQKFIDNQAHTVQVDSFYIDKHEVTNFQYAEFCVATGHKFPEFWGMDKFTSGLKFPDHPVVGVTWSDAKDYAEWKGFRLPTEAEWEYASRGGLAGMRYPNGNDMDSSLANYNTTQGMAMKVGSYPANAFGLYDMSGNALEWVWDFYDKDYYLESPYANPQGPLYGKRRSVRGGGWRSGVMCATVNFRQSLRTYWVDFSVGFRCAKDL